MDRTAICLSSSRSARVEESSASRLTMEIFAFANQKGGVDKTANTVNVGAALAESGQRVLLVDFDPQGHLSEVISFCCRGLTSPSVAAAVVSAVDFHCWPGP